MYRFRRTNESNDIYKMEACIARKHLKKRGSEEADVIRSTSSEAVH